MLVLGKPELQLPLHIIIGLFQSSENKLSNRQLKGKMKTLKFWEFSTNKKIFWVIL